jgi:hypothetical protein
MRQRAAELNAGACDDLPRLGVRAREPSHIFAAPQRLDQNRLGLSLQRVERAGREFPHVLKHAAAVPGDDRGIVGRGRPHSKAGLGGYGHGSI